MGTRTSARRIVFYAILSLLAPRLYAQSYINPTLFSRQIIMFSAAPDMSFSEIGYGISFHKIVWNPQNSSACQVEIQTSPDGATWTTLGVAQTCTSPGEYQAPSQTANYVRMKLDSFMGTQVTLRYYGFPPVEQTSLSNVNLVEVGGASISLGQTTMSASLPVTIASDQTPIPVSVTFPSTVTVVQPTGSNLHTDVDNFPANQTVVQPTGSNLHTDVDNFPATQPISGTVSISGNVNVTQGTNPWIDNVQQWNGVTVSAAQNSSGDGTQTAPIVRPILRKYAQVSTTANLGANASFTSAWIDTQQTGGNFLLVEAFANQIGAASGFWAQGTNDTGNSNLFIRCGQYQGASSVAVNTLAVFYGWCPFRYWRVNYTNGATPQTSFELVATETDAPPGVALGESATNIGGSTNGFPHNGFNIPTVVAPTTGNAVASLIVTQTTTNGNDGTAFNQCYLSYAGNCIAPLVTMMYSTTGGGNNSNTVQARTPVIYKSIKAVSVTSGTPVSVWTPAAGKKFRVMGWMLSLSVAGSILFEDTTGTEVFRTSLMSAGVGLASPEMKNGYISTAANNQLFLDVTSTGTVSGYIFGTEE